MHVSACPHAILCIQRSRKHIHTVRMCRCTCARTHTLSYPYAHAKGNANSDTRVHHLPIDPFPLDPSATFSSSLSGDGANGAALVTVLDSISSNANSQPTAPSYTGTQGSCLWIFCLSFAHLLCSPSLPNACVHIIPLSLDTDAFLSSHQLPAHTI